MYGYAISNVRHAVTSLSVYCIYFTLILFLVQAHQGHWATSCLLRTLFNAVFFCHMSSLSLFDVLPLLLKDKSFFEQLVLIA